MELITKIWLKIWIKRWWKGWLMLMGLKGGSGWILIRNRNRRKSWRKWRMRVLNRLLLWKWNEFKTRLWPRGKANNKKNNKNKKKNGIVVIYVPNAQALWVIHIHLPIPHRPSDKNLKTEKKPTERLQLKLPPRPLPFGRMAMAMTRKMAPSMTLHSCFLLQQKKNLKRPSWTARMGQIKYPTIQKAKGPKIMTQPLKKLRTARS